MRPNWVVNTLKYDRALLQIKNRVLTGQAKEVTEEAVKEVYVGLGGLLLEQAPENIQVAEARPETVAKKNKKK